LSLDDNLLHGVAVCSAMNLNMGPLCHRCSQRILLFISFSIDTEHRC